uniref:EOG090X0FJX n=1 Tax=Lynceus sp. MCZ IZ 141354 TaxID=1930659 RepID=A0A9N6ZHF6_9CRUS|nr:EOG090X0FJX [Lynceus sp. MCZ IZ 141354]
MSENCTSHEEANAELSEMIAKCILEDESRAMDTKQDQVEASNEAPTSIIVTSLPVSLFDNKELKTEFEALFRFYDPEAEFRYLKSFRRARVDCTNAAAASKARTHLHQTPLNGCHMNCYFSQPVIIKGLTNEQFLKLPAPVKQFLISPPASPPVDWAPATESEPNINYDLLTAVANLGPGDAHELHPQSESQPSIVVHVCEDLDPTGKLKIHPTRCPQRQQDS